MRDRATRGRAEDRELDAGLRYTAGSRLGGNGHVDLHGDVRAGSDL